MKRQDIAAAIVVTVVALLFIYQTNIVHALGALKLLPEPEPFTELYLNDYPKLSQSLPTALVRGSAIAFSFTIHNEEGKDTAYPYLVYAAGGTMATTTIDAGTIVLASNASTSIPEAYTFTAAQKQAEVFVTLTSLNQSLHFYVPDKR